MNKVASNAIMNIIARIWSMISIYIFVPLYIRLLGETSYGLVSFFSTLQMAFNLLGLGLSNTLRREFAVGHDAKEDKIKKYKLLRSVELIYWVIAVVICSICFLFSHKIATIWLNIENLDPEMVSNVITLMGISIAIQLVANLYSGCLFGLNCQIVANTSCIVWSAAKYVGSLLIIWLIKPDLILFYFCHILCDLLYCVFLRMETIRKLCIEKGDKRWTVRDVANIKNVWKYTCGVLTISFIALINKQFDKVIISNYLTITELGAYNVATTLGSVTAIIPTAMYITVFPMFTKYATTGENESLRKVFSIFSRVTNIVLSCMLAFVSIFSDVLIRVWTGSDYYVSTLGVVSVFIVMAVGLVEFQELPYALALAHGNTRYNIIVGCVFIPLTFIFTFCGIKNYGLFGAGMISMLLMLGQTILFLVLVYKKYIYSNPFKHIVSEMIFPLLFSVFIAILCKEIINSLTENDLIIVIMAILSGGITLILQLFTMVRKELLTIIYFFRKDC